MCYWSENEPPPASVTSFRREAFTIQASSNWADMSAKRRSLSTWVCSVRDFDETAAFSPSSLAAYFSVCLTTPSTMDAMDSRYLVRLAGDLSDSLYVDSIDLRTAISLSRKTLTSECMLYVL